MSNDQSYILPGDIVTLSVPDYPVIGTFVKAIPEGAVVKTSKGLIAVGHTLYALKRHVVQPVYVGVVTAGKRVAA